ncbi:MAG: hypothetical protein KJ666_12490, partial [Bacteroidetes bacterium]|nr:hypothetical protein [Bacteroidota bacterium]
RTIIQRQSLSGHKRITTKSTTLPSFAKAILKRGLARCIGFAQSRPSFLINVDRAGLRAFTNRYSQCWDDPNIPVSRQK